MKKTIALVTALAFLAVGCGKGKVDSSSGGKTTLSYLAWNVGTEEENTVERQMLQRFQANNPDVTLNILQPPLKEDGTKGDYNEYMNALASKKQLPDVFMWAGVADTVINGWSLDATELTTNDPDYSGVVESLKLGGTINGKSYGLPYAMHMAGIAQNYNIFDELNVEPLEYTYTLEELMDKISKTTTDKYKGTDMLNIQDWGVMSLNDKMGYGTFDGEKYNFSSPEFAKVVDYYQNMVSKGQIGNSQVIDAKDWLPEGIKWPWGQGYVAIQQEAPWFLFSASAEDFPFKTDLLPLPNEQVLIVPDYIYISNATANKQKAYELAKWMSFGKDAMAQRLEINKTADKKSYISMPINAGMDAAQDEFFLKDYADYPNFIKMYKSIKEKPQNVRIENVKIIPGYSQSRYTTDTGVTGSVKVDDKMQEKSLNVDELINAILKGDKQLADYAEEIDKIANQKFEEATASIKNK